MATIRYYLTSRLRPLLPVDWKLIETQKTLETITKPVVIVKQQRLERAPEAPQGAMRVTYVITIASPYAERERAELQLDESVIELVDALHAIPGLRWTSAEKVLLDDKYVAYDITAELTTKKEA